MPISFYVALGLVVGLGLVGLGFVWFSIAPKGNHHTAEHPFDGATFEKPHTESRRVSHRAGMPRQRVSAG